MITIKRKFKQNYKTGFPILQAEAVLGKVTTEEGQVVKLVDDAENYLCTAYIGHQNKGLGWVLSLDEDEKINYTFFYDRLKIALERRHKFLILKKPMPFVYLMAKGMVLVV